MDISSFFSDAADKVKKELSSAWEVAGPALQASAEKQAISWLQTQNKDTQAVVDAQVKKLANSPPAPPGSFMASLQATLGGSLVKEKGPMIIMAVAGIGIVFYFLGSRK